MGAVQQLVDRKNREKLPIQIICVTESDVDGLMGAIGRPHSKTKGVLYARSTVHGKAFYALAQSWGPDGSPSKNYVSRLVKADASAIGAPLFSKEGIKDKKVLLAWWYITNGDYSAMKGLVKMAKKTDEAKGLLDQIESFYKEKIDATMANPISTLDDYDALATYVENMNDSKTLKSEIKAAKKVLKAALKDDVLKDEFAARLTYRKVTGPSNAGCREIWDRLIGGLTMITKKYPGTKFGEKAQQKLDTLNAGGFREFANNFKSGGC